MKMKEEPAPTPMGLAVRLATFFTLFILLLVALLIYSPTASQYLPMGGHNALGDSNFETIQQLLGGESEEVKKPKTQAIPRLEEVRWVLIFGIAHLLGTIIAMLPIAWTYTAWNYADGFRKNFVRSLILLPLCATTIVLLIQDSLALAFGLAAMVAAVRFRVTLEDASDGIFIFASIGVGLATGVGHLGIALLMSIFFCFACTIMWARDYGANPLDEARIAKKREKLSATNVTDSASG